MLKGSTKVPTISFIVHGQINHVNSYVYDNSAHVCDSLPIEQNSMRLGRSAHRKLIINYTMYGVRGCEV